MSYDPEKVHDILLDQREKSSEELEHFFLQFEDLWERKLWHELTATLLEFYELPASAPQRIVLYDTFINSFAEKINQLRLVTLGLSAATQSKGIVISIRHQITKLTCSVRSSLKTIFRQRSCWKGE